MNHLKTFFRSAKLAALTLLVSTPAIASNDVLAKLDGGNIMNLSAWDSDVDLGVTHGTISLTTEDPECIASPTHPCNYTLNRLHFRLGDFTVEVENIGDYSARDLFISIDGPIPLQDSGSGMFIPAGTRVRSGIRVSGPEIDPGVRIGSDHLDNPVLILFAPGSNLLTVDGSFPIYAEVVDQVFSATASGMMTSWPVLNTAPVINTGPDLELTCADFVDLSPSVTDKQGNQQHYSWNVRPQGAVHQRLVEASPRVYFPPGLTEVSLLVSDIYGGVGRDNFLINVQDPPPSFVEEPDTFYASTCGQLDLPVPEVISECGGIVESDAPSVFYAGSTLVTWTARTRTGRSASVTQWVIVALGDDAACCPPNANVIRGTSNNDRLVGTEGDDCILGYGAQDIIDGRGGNDVISAGEGDDQIVGGSGADSIFAGSGQDYVSGNDGNDFLQGGGGDDQCYGGNGDDQIWGGQGQDRIYSGAGNDIAHGDDGDDQIYGGAGDDFIDGGINNDSCWGGTGIDTGVECLNSQEIEDFGDPPYSADPEYLVCSCRPNKCNDCSGQVNACQGSADCAAIIQCISEVAGCNLPHECSQICESGRNPEAIQLARQTASCMGGCL